MPTPKEHWGYTITEWTNGDFRKITDALSDIHVLYDIGANVGGFTHVLREEFPNIRAYCFEPVRVNYLELLKNVPYAKHFPFGIFYGAKESKVLWRGGNDGAYFVEQIDSSEPRVATGETMHLYTLEELPIEKPDLIKLDVEGAEENIIEHSEIVKDCHNLIIEWHHSTEPIAFFNKYLPKHRVVVNLDNKQFLLCLK